MNEEQHSISKKEQQKIEHFVKVIQEHKTAMFRLAYSIVLNQEDAEDVVSEAILKAYSHLNHLRHLKKMKAWIFQIVVNESKNCLSKRKDFMCFDNMEYLTESEQEEGTATDLLEYVYQLEDSFRFVVLLYYFDGFSVKETANILNLSEGTVKSRLSRARGKLKNYLQKGGIL